MAPGVMFRNDKNPHTSYTLFGVFRSSRSLQVSAEAAGQIVPKARTQTLEGDGGVGCVFLHQICCTKATLEELLSLLFTDLTGEENISKISQEGENDIKTTKSQKNDLKICKDSFPKLINLVIPFQL